MLSTRALSSASGWAMPVSPASAVLSVPPVSPVSASGVAVAAGSGVAVAAGEEAFSPAGGQADRQGGGAQQGNKLSHGEFSFLVLRISDRGGRDHPARISPGAKGTSQGSAGRVSKSSARGQASSARPENPARNRS